MSSQANNGQNGRVDADMFDIGGFLRVLSGAVRHHKFLVLFTCLLTLALTTLYVYIWPPIYKVQAQLAAERTQDPARDTFYANWQVFRKEDPRDEIILFKSGPVLRKVIDDLDLTYDDVHHPFMSHAGYLWEKSWLGRQYTALKDWVAPDPNPPNPDNKELGRVLDGLQAGIYIAGEGDSQIAKLEVKGPSRRVSDVANALIDTYLAFRRQRQFDESQSAFKVLEEEAQKAHLELTEARVRREAFALRHGLMFQFDKESLDVKELATLETSISNQKAKVAALQASLNKFGDQLRAEQPTRVLSSTREVNAVRENARLRRLEFQTSLIGLRNRYREDSPEVQEALVNLAKLDALIEQEPEHIDRSVIEGVNTLHQQLTVSRDQLLSELEGMAASVAALESTAAQSRKRLTGLPTTMSEALDLNREYDLAAEKYQRLQLRKIEAQVSATASVAAPASVKVVDYAAPPSTKYWPRMKYLYPGALLAGLALGVIAAVLRSLTSGRLLRSHMDRGRIATPVYATIGVGRTARSLTVVGRESAPTQLPATTPPKGPDRSRSAGA